MDVKHIFRSYDIRGIYGKDINEDIIERIGKALGKFSKSNFVIANDCRSSSESMKEAFVTGLSCSNKIIDAGLIPIGAGMFLAWKRGYDLAYITASHLPKEWNGVKFFHSNGVGYMEDENCAIRDIFLKGDKEKAVAGHITKENSAFVMKEYRESLNKKITTARKLNVVLDCGNGMAGLVAADIFKGSGFKTTAIFEKPDGNFPNRGPDPGEDPLAKLSAAEKDVGIAYDGDGDRMILVDDRGRKIQAEQTAYMILQELLKREKGPIVANIECTRLIDTIAGKFGRKVIRVPVGHTFLVEGVHKNKACFGVESAGHYIIPSLIPFDDALSVSLYAAYAISKQDKKASEIVDEMPKLPFERISFDCADSKKFEVMKALKKQLLSEYSEAITIDGIRVDMPEGWVLVRPSNTSPIIRMTIEARNMREKNKIRSEFSKKINDLL